MRKIWIDYLRITAVVAVVIGHVTADFYKNFGEIGQIDWWFANIIISFARFAVCVFVMISGAVLLGKRYTIIEFYKKRAVRLLPAIIFWNLFYLGFFVCTGMDNRTLIWMLKAQIIADGFSAPHLWYLSMFACLMLFTPFINQFLNGKKPTFIELSLLLGLMAIFIFLYQFSSILIEIFNISMDWFKIFIWYIIYFIGGFYINQYGEKINIKKSTILILILIFVFTGALLNYYSASSLGIVKDYFIFSDAGIFNLVLSSLVFLLAMKSSPSLVDNRLVLTIAEASFGIYLIHEIFNAIIIRNIPDYYSHPLLYIPLVSVTTFVLSFLSIILLRKIPVLRAVC